MAPKRKAARRDEVALIVVEEVEDAKLKLKAVAAKAYAELTTETRGVLDIMDRSRIAEYYVEVMASGEAQSKIFRKKVEETPTEYVSRVTDKLILYYTKKGQRT